MKKLKVFEVFAGYGSQSMALRNLGIDYEVVGISEVDADAVIAYSAVRDFKIDENIDINKAKEELMSINVGWNFKSNKSSIPRMNKDKLIKLYSANKHCKNLGDISKLKVEDVPEHDLFTYSFPCQDLSVAGKQGGLIRGATRSGLLYECEKIIEHHKPKYLLLENVKNLVGKKFKPQFDEWLKYLEGLGYTNYWKVLNSKDYGVPQNRERVFVVSILNDTQGYEFPKPFELDKCLKDILEDEIDDKYYINRPFTLVDRGRVVAEFVNGNFDQSKRIYGVDSYFQTLSAADRGTNNILVDGYLTGVTYKQTSKILSDKGISPTLDTMQGGLREPKVIDYKVKENLRVRKLTPKECFRLMGVSDEDVDKIKNIGISNSQQYKLAGNSIVVDVLEGIFRELLVK